MNHMPSIQDQLIHYDIAAIRDLLHNAFSVDALQRFCRDRSVFRPTLAHLSPRASLHDTVDALLEYCQKQALLPELLAAVEDENPRQYERHRNRLHTSSQLEAGMEQLRARQAQTDRRRRAVRDRQRVVNLRPLDVTEAFKDRLRETQALCEHLADSGVRLVSVVGRGGMGKTALASRVLADLECGWLPVPGGGQAQEIDGILYLSARSTGLGLERIYADVGRMVGEPAASRLSTRWAEGEMALTAKVEYLLEAMQDGVYLILLDNLEDYLMPEGTIAEEGLRLFVERCLTQPSGARLIVTSREEVKVASAALRGTRRIPLREGLLEDDAVSLLRDLDPQGQLGLRDAPEGELLHAVRLVRGIPRALEILAGILHRDPTSSLGELLADEELFGEQVVEQLVAEGYRRLGEDERRVMEALAVFDRPVEETAIAYLLYPWFPALAVRACLRHLVNGHFVGINRITGEYSLHPLDREYAYRRIPDPAADEGSSNAYTRANLELRAAGFYASIRRPESEWQSIEDLSPQLAEFEHRVRGGDYTGAGRVLEPIDTDYLFVWGHYNQLAEMREKLLAYLPEPTLQAANIISLGRSVRLLGMVERAIRLYEQALSISQASGDRAIQGRCLGCLGRAYRDLGQTERAIEFHRQALAIAREIGDHREEGAQLGFLGSAYRELGQYKLAFQYYQDALTIACDLGYSQEEDLQLGRLGIAYYASAQFYQAIDCYERALLIASQTQYHRQRSAWLFYLGRVYHALGDTRQAIELYKQALIIAQDIGHRRQQSDCLLGLASAHFATEELDRAQRCCEESLNLDTPTNIYRAKLVLGIVLLNQHSSRASNMFAEAIDSCRVRLNSTAGLYEPRYALAAALVGQATCDAHWANIGERSRLLAPAIEEYRRALETCSAPGIVGDALRDLEMIRAAGIEGLGPAFDLLRAHLEDGGES